jgi:hypothetical protein
MVYRKNRGSRDEQSGTAAGACLNNLGHSAKVKRLGNASVAAFNAAISNKVGTLDVNAY